MSSKIFFAETEETVSKSVFYSETISFSFLEIVQATLVEVPSVLTFKLESIFSTMSRVLAWEVSNFTFSLWLGKSIKGFLGFEVVVVSTIFSSIRSSYWPITRKDSLVKLFCSIILIIGVWSLAILKGEAFTSVLLHFTRNVSRGRWLDLTMLLSSLTKFDFFYYIQMVLGNFILWNIIVFKKIRKQNVFFQLIHLFFFFFHFLLTRSFSDWAKVLW